MYAKKQILVFLKYSKTGNKFTVLNAKKNLNHKNLKKVNKWHKNSFFIIKTIKGLLCLKKSLAIKIGGFLLYKIF